MDGSAFALSAAAWGAQLAAHSKVPLTLLHVLELRLVTAPLFADISGALGAAPFEHAADGLNAALNERGKNIISAGREICAGHGVEARSRMEPGVLAEVVREITHDDDLLVLGRRGESAGHGRHLLGTEGERAIRMADCSCLATPEKFRAPTQIITGANDSGPARSAMAWTEYFHEIFPDARLQPLHVTEEREDRSFEGETVAGHEVEIVHGDPEEVIVSAGAGEDESLCLIGATGHTRTLKEIILGTLSFHVLHKTSGAVLLAR